MQYNLGIYVFYPFLCFCYFFIKIYLFLWTIHIRFWWHHVTFCAPTILKFWVEKGGGIDQIQKCLGTFSLDFWWIITQKVPQKLPKKISPRKSAPTVPQFLGVVRPGLENTKVKASLTTERKKLPYKIYIDI